jgi:hypothetical protein
MKKNRKVTKQEVKKLLSESNCAKDEEISEAALADTYVMPDGQVLVVDSTGKGRLWESRDDIIAVIQQAAEPPEHILTGLLPAGKKFVDSIPSLIGQLPDKLKINRKSLDFSWESLTLIDQQVFSRIGRKKCLTPELFEPLLAYAGETMRRRKNGKWEMRLSSDGTTWEPWIITDDFKFPPFSYLHEQLYESGPAPSIAAVFW